MPTFGTVDSLLLAFLPNPSEQLMKKSFVAIALAAAIAAPAFGQANNSGLEITKIESVFEKTPEFSISIGPKRRSNSKDWLFVEVEFTYEPKGPTAPKFLDELTFNYYILLNNRTPAALPTLLTGSVVHTAIMPGKGMRSAAFVSPRTIERFFDGKAPANANQAVMAVGVTITRQGQVVAELSTGEGKGRPQWWNQFQQAPPGFVLNKNETPFAPLFSDYFEALKAKPAGL